MAQFIGEKSLVTGKIEGNAYGTGSGSAIWLGIPQSATPAESMNRESYKAMDGTNRNISGFIDKGQDVGWTQNIWMQNGRLFMFALGSVSTNVAGSPNYVHTISQDSYRAASGYMPSATLYHSFVDQAGNNMNRVTKGCVVDNLGIESSEGEPVVLTPEWVGQTNVYDSGAIQTVTAQTTRPYMWSDGTFTIGGADYSDALKSFSSKIGNNLLKIKPHNQAYIREPTPQRFNGTMTLGILNMPVTGGNLWADYYYSGTQFNAKMKYQRTSANDYVEITYSGCKVTTPSYPMSNEGGQELTLEVEAATVGVVVGDTISTYN